ncbi:MAG TPA: Trp family transcriptional regulator [Spirochaetota bacterium]|nr:Trp family transcriptional regulator [Spirochaetota bacterium]HOM39232.1 Trp family transcriptional regulator [Spirochaetota bacterium]HPQ49931.1 Trp family transcriptional regulator [Spirochaetota bacterium]
MKNYLEDLAYAFMMIRNKDDMLKFFDEIFTKNEIKKFEERWKLLTHLFLGEKQREIAKKFNLSLCKITRGAKILKNKKSITYQLLSEIYKEK